jgi:hypothetical protein
MICLFYIITNNENAKIRKKNDMEEKTISADWQVAASRQLIAVSS